MSWDGEEEEPHTNIPKGKCFQGAKCKRVSRRSDQMSSAAPGPIRGGLRVH